MKVQISIGKDTSKSARTLSVGSKRSGEATGAAVCGTATGFAGTGVVAGAATGGAEVDAGLGGGVCATATSATPPATNAAARA